MEDRSNTAVGGEGRGMANWRTTNINENGGTGREYFQLDIKCSLNHWTTPGFFLPDRSMVFIYPKCAISLFIITHHHNELHRKN